METETMTEVVSVRFKQNGKIYYFSPNRLNIRAGQHVIVETAKGLEYGECAVGNHMVSDAEELPQLRPVIRIATRDDDRRVLENRKREKEALAKCRECIEEYGLEMKLISAEYNFDGTKVMFFFTAEGRVDFRELVRTLASLFKMRVELRQVGVRDEARILGGLGSCGRPYCCHAFLDEFQPVSIKMAKSQGLSLNPTKISGVCGRLMCCLKYEEEAYEELIKNVPKNDAFVDTPDGKGTVVDVNLLKSTVRVRLEGLTELTIKTYNAADVTVLGGKAKRAEYLAELEEERKQREAAKASVVFRHESTETRSGDNIRNRQHRKQPPKQKITQQYAPPRMSENASGAESAQKYTDAARRSRYNNRRKTRGDGKDIAP